MALTNPALPLRSTPPRRGSRSPPQGASWGCAWGEGRWSRFEWVWAHTVPHGTRATLLSTLSSMPSAEPGTQLVPNECL